MNYGEIKKYDIADGPGVRVTLFVIQDVVITVKVVLMQKHGIFIMGIRILRRLKKKFWMH